MASAVGNSNDSHGPPQLVRLLRGSIHLLGIAIPSPGNSATAARATARFQFGP